MARMAELTRELRARIEALLHDSVVSAVAVAGGYTPAARWLITLRSRDKVFVKVGTTAYTAEALRLEWQVYSTLTASFMPQLIAWDDHPAEPMLVLEDLSVGFWPPPWQPPLVDEVREALDAVHRSRANLKPFTEVLGTFEDGWREVADDPEPFLTLSLVSREWLERALPRLMVANAQVELTGTEVVHFDVRSDNTCRVPRGIVFVDWNHACLGNGALDTGFWLPSLQAEGGPAPEETLPDRPDIAALVSGFFACRAGLPAIPDAPGVRAVQLQQLVPALHWAARALELPPPNPPSRVQT
jgi:hypothetical protein